MDPCQFHMCPWERSNQTPKKKKTLYAVWEYLLRATTRALRRPFYKKPAEHLTEVHTEKYDHNIVVKSQPNLPLPELRIAYPAIALRSNWGMQHSRNCRKGKKYQQQNRDWVYVTKKLSRSEKPGHHVTMDSHMTVLATKVGKPSRMRPSVL